MALFDSWRANGHEQAGQAEPTLTMQSDIERYLRGAVRLVRTVDGLIQPYRFSAKQMEMLGHIGRSERAVATSGVVIDFITDGNAVSFDCQVTRKLDHQHDIFGTVMQHEGVLGRAEDGVIDGIDVVAGGLRSYTTAVRDGIIDLSFDNPDHDRVEVRIYLPYIMSVAVGNLASNGSIESAPERGYLLALGDSITQGFVVGCPSLTYPSLVATSLGLDLVNQGIAGHVFDRRTLRGLEDLHDNPPVAITVAYGTNDWTKKDSPRSIQRGAERYLSRLLRTFPNVPIYVMSPLWRSDEHEAVAAGIPLTWVGSMLENLCRQRKNLHFVDGYHAIPKNSVMLADGRLHPGSVDAGLVADVLIARLTADRVTERTESVSHPSPYVETIYGQPESVVSRLYGERGGAGGKEGDGERAIGATKRNELLAGVPFVDEVGQDQADTVADAASETGDAKEEDDLQPGFPSDPSGTADSSAAHDVADGAPPSHVDEHGAGEDPAVADAAPDFDGEGDEDDATAESPANASEDAVDEEARPNDPGRPTDDGASGRAAGVREAQEMPSVEDAEGDVPSDGGADVAVAPMADGAVRPPASPSTGNDDTPSTATSGRPLATSSDGAAAQTDGDATDGPADAAADRQRPETPPGGGRDRQSDAVGEMSPAEQVDGLDRLSDAAVASIDRSGLPASMRHIVRTGIAVVREGLARGSIDADSALVAVASYAARMASVAGARSDQLAMVADVAAEALIVQMPELIGMDADIFAAPSLADDESVGGEESSDAEPMAVSDDDLAEPSDGDAGASAAPSSDDDRETGRDGARPLAPGSDAMAALGEAWDDLDDSDDWDLDAGTALLADPFDDSDDPDDLDDEEDDWLSMQALATAMDMYESTSAFQDDAFDDALLAVLDADAENRARPGAPSSHGEFDRLVRTVWRLRQQDGCPWDLEQTHRSIMGNMVEEAYEAVEAIQEDDVAHMREELGDVLEQVLLHAQIAADQGEFTIDDVCRDLNKKLIRRHPHVFGDEHAETAEDALRIWKEVKLAERGLSDVEAPARGSLDSIPRTLPPLMQCQKISNRVARLGFDWESVEQVWEKVSEESLEFTREPRGSDEALMEFGDLLFTLVNVARFEGIDASKALQASNEKFRRRWILLERLAVEGGRDPQTLSQKEFDMLWRHVKSEESLGALLRSNFA